MNSEVLIRASGHKPKKWKRRQYYGNHYSYKGVDFDTKLSTSLKEIQGDSPEIKFEQLDINVYDCGFLNKNILFSALPEWLCCDKCHIKGTLNSEEIYRLTMKLNNSCCSCGLLSSTILISEEFNSESMHSGDLFDVSHETYWQRASQSKAFCGVMDLTPTVTEKSYIKIVSMHTQRRRKSYIKNGMFLSKINCKWWWHMEN